jgi:hypothetical protein
VPADLGEREAASLLYHLGIEGVDPAVGDVARWPASRDDQRQMLERLFLPDGHVREDVFDRPLAYGARLH